MELGQWVTVSEIAEFLGVNTLSEIVDLMLRREFDSEEHRTIKK